jgi:hypothetical protein
MCSHLVHLAKTPVLTIDNMLLDLLWSLSFAPSWCRAMQLSYSPAQIRGRKIMDDDEISIYTPEKLERLESPRVQEFVHTRVYDINLLKKGEMDVDLPTSGGWDPTDRAHDRGIWTRSGDVAFLHRLTDQHRQQPLESPWPQT